jgi:hypothetical protein
MEIRNQSKTGPLVPPLVDLPAKLSQQLDAVKQQWLDQWNRDPASFARLEVEIHDHFRRLADQTTASLLAEATISQDQAEPGKKGGADTADRSRRPPQTRRLKLRFLGGLTVWIATIYCAPRSRTGRGRGREGTGAYPELAPLGIRKGATPALHSQVGRLTALLPSIEIAREELRHQGPTLDEKTVHRMVRQLGAEVLATRTRDLQRFRDGQLPAGQERAGQHVVAQVDGGRIRIRTQVETKKRKGVKYRPKIRVEWREPKVLIISLSDRKGRMLRGTRPWIDGTMNGPDHLRELLTFHLHRLGGARAKAVSFVSDGAPWIGNRLDWVVGRAGLDPKRVERILDCCHAAHHISLALQALGLAEEERTATYRTLRHQLRAGRSRDVVATLREMAAGQPADSDVGTEIEYLNKHEAHRRYDGFGYRGRPRGSGAVESAIRRVINLRLKGNGISWREENAEAMLVLRAAALTGRWEETMERAQESMATDRRRDWQWKAPDIEAELNSGMTIKPPSSQPESAEQAEAIAA